LNKDTSRLGVSGLGIGGWGAGIRRGFVLLVPVARVL
jgi:hypothetical protein